MSLFFLFPPSSVFPVRHSRAKNSKTMWGNSMLAQNLRKMARHGGRFFNYLQKLKKYFNQIKFLLYQSFFTQYEYGKTQKNSKKEMFLQFHKFTRSWIPFSCSVSNAQRAALIQRYFSELSCLPNALNQFFFSQRKQQCTSD